MYFIAGMLFIYFVIPLLEGLLSFIVTWISRLEVQESAKIYKIKQAATAEEEEESKAVIGFVYEEEEEEE